MASDLHMSVEMTGDQAEDTRRRALAYATAITHAVSNPAIREKMGMETPTDPQRRLRLALGAAYSDLYMGIGRQVIIRRLRDLLEEPEIAGVKLAHHSHLTSIVASRSRGNLSGDHISKIQLELLTEALGETPDQTNPEPPDAA
jgi:hypothetical protein